MEAKDRGHKPCVAGRRLGARRLDNGRAPILLLGASPRSGTHPRSEESNTAMTRKTNTPSTTNTPSPSNKTSPSNRTARAGALLLGLALISGSAQAAPGPDDHAGHGTPHHAHPAATAGAEAPSTRAFREAGTQMHGDMDIAYSGDVDHDFAAGMIPHHQGAIAMAKVALQYSKDPEVRALAESIVKAQDAEIAQMQAILKRKPAPAK